MKPERQPTRLEIKLFFMKLKKFGVKEWKFDENTSKLKSRRGKKTDLIGDGEKNTT